MLSVETLHCSRTSYFDPSTNQHSACMHPAMSLRFLIGLHISSSPEPLFIIIHKSCFSLSTTASASCFATLGESPGTAGEALGQNQDVLQRLHLSAGLGMPCCHPGRAGGSGEGSLCSSASTAATMIWITCRNRSMESFTHLTLLSF